MDMIATVTYSQETKSLLVKEETIQQTPSTAKTITAPQGSTLVVNPTNLRIFNGPETIFHAPNIKIADFFVKITNNGKLIAVTYEPQTKSLSIKEELLQETSETKTIPKVTNAPQGSTLVLNSALHITNGQNPFLDFSSIEIKELVLKVVKTQEILGIKKP
ncbi:MAG: hypothetical protein WC297_01555 [Candidatus Paceibacterota bacterium]|jgi:hypothetical protein